MCGRGLELYTTPRFPPSPNLLPRQGAARANSSHSRQLLQRTSAMAARRATRKARRKVMTRAGKKGGKRKNQSQNPSINNGRIVESKVASVQNVGPTQRTSPVSEEANPKEVKDNRRAARERAPWNKETKLQLWISSHKRLLRALWAWHRLRNAAGHRTLM